MTAGVLARFVLLAALTAATVPAATAQGLATHVTVAKAVAANASHARTLRVAMAHAIAAQPLPAGYTVDVALVRLDVVATPQGELEVRAELRASLSDDQGIVRSVAATSTSARGRRRDRALIQRDAITEGARSLAKRLAART